MKNGIFTIFKKELKRFFGDRRTLVAIFMPGILIYLIYSLMGSALGEMFTQSESTSIIYTINKPIEISFDAEDSNTKVEEIDVNEKESTLENIKNDGKAVLVVFPKNFYNDMLTYSPVLSVTPPNVEIYYNSADTDSAYAYSFVTSILQAYESAISNKFDINADYNEKYDLASETDIASMMFSTLMPMLLVMLLFSGCMAVAPESIAGEKERGTIASLLITPVKRSHIAIGKILALAVISIISGASSTIGVIASLPKLLALDEASIDGSIYGVNDYLMLSLVILSTALLFVSMVSILSAYAKSVKEASSYVSPLMIIVTLVGVSGMFGASEIPSVAYMIPVYNSVQCIINIFSLNINIMNILITTVSNLAVTAILTFVLTKMFDSEKIMFNK